MQVAADLALLDERGRLAGGRLLAQLRRPPREAERGEDARLVRRVGSGSSAATKSGAPVARSSAVPYRSGAVTTSSTGMPSTVSPTARRSSCSIIATICGSEANRATTAAGSAAAHTTASRSHESRHRRTSPAASPPSSSAIPPTSSRAWLSSSPRGGRGSSSRASASSSCASSFGPTPGTSRSRPAAAAARNSSGVCTPSARAMSTDRLAVSPR